MPQSKAKRILFFAFCLLMLIAVQTGLTEGTAVANEDIIYNENGKFTQKTFLNESGEIVEKIEVGYAIIRREYDDDSNITRETYYDIYDAPTLSVNGYAGLARRYDVDGNIVWRAYLGLDGQPMILDDYAILRRVYENGFVAVESYYDANENPIARVSGYATRRRAYDDTGNIVREKYYDVSGAPTFSSSGYAGREIRYDTDGNIVWQAYLGVDGQPMVPNDFAILHRVYEAGNIAEESYYDINELPILRKNGYALLRRTYDENGFVKTEKYFDLSDSPTLSSNGYAGRERRYDADGNIVWQAFLNESGERMYVSGYAIFQRTYEDGLLMEESYWDANENPLTRGTQYASMRRSYDENSNIIRESYYDLQGSPVLRDTGIASVVRMYDIDGNIVQESYFDENGAPVIKNTSGVAIIRRIYDESGNVALETYYDEMGAPAYSLNGYHGRVRGHDADGNMLWQSYRDENGNPMTVEGFAIARRIYENGLFVEESYYDMNDSLVLRTEGFATMRRAYDVVGTLLRETYYGVDGQPILRDTGNAGIAFEYDAQGHVVRETFLNEAGQAAPGANGYTSLLRAYDDGRLITEIYTDENGNTIQTADGFALVEVVYDQYGNETERLYYDVNGNNVPPPVLDEVA